MYTRRGDGGETSLYGKRRVRKDDPRVEAYGTVDELNSLLGVVVSQTKDRKVVAQLKEVQRLLFVAGADLAAEFHDKGLPRIDASDTLRVEKMTDELLEGLDTLRNFILPGGSPVGAQLQLARAVCRRAERRITAASHVEKLNPELLPFFNRLSSYLFNLSRAVNQKAGVGESVWRA